LSARSRLAGAWYSNPTNWQAAQTRVKTFECISDNLATDTSARGTSMAFHFFNYQAAIAPNTDDKLTKTRYSSSRNNPTVLGGPTTPAAAAWAAAD